MTEMSAAALMRDAVPPALEDAARIASGVRDGSMSPVDLLISDGRLRDLISSLDSACRSDAPTGLRTNELEDLEQTPDGGATAYAPMAFCPESVLIVHSPIVLGRLCGLAHRALPAGRLPVALEGVRFRRPLVSDVTLHLVPDGAALPAKAPVGGRLLDDAGTAWSFAAVPLADRPVTRWVDNREVTGTVAITAAPEAPVRRFHLEAMGTGSQIPFPAEAVQMLLEAVIRAVVAHRSLDGRAILLTGLPRLSWPTDLAERIARGGRAEVTARPGDRLRGGSPWHALDVTLSGDLGDGRLHFVEGRTTLTDLFG